MFCFTRFVTEFQDNLVNQFPGNNASLSQDKNVQKSPANLAEMFPNKFVTRFPNNPANLFQDKNANLLRGKNAKMFPANLAEMFLNRYVLFLHWFYL